MLIPLRVPQPPKEKKRKAPQLILVCAWCPKEKYPELSVSEYYSHGICPEHATYLLQKMNYMHAEEESSNSR